MRINSTDEFIYEATCMAYDFAKNHVDSDEDVPVFVDVFAVRHCKTPRSIVALVSTTLHSDIYYEVTYDEDKDEICLDAYKKFERQCIKYK